jgi:hypothetical protein
MQGLSGTKKDITNFIIFLTGYTGGAWSENEILYPLYNPSKSTLLNIVNRLKGENNDYVIALLGGHSGQKR